jgi:hypothetical protein
MSMIKRIHHKLACLLFTSIFCRLFTIKRIHHKLGYNFISLYCSLFV